MSQLQCPKCGSPMEEGFLGDNSRSGVLQSRWYPGKAEPEEFLGMELSNLTVDPRQAVVVSTFRCTACGFLESYAPKGAPQAGSSGGEAGP